MSAKVTSYLKKLSETPAGSRVDLVELLRLKNYGSNELSEHQMWILDNAAKNQTYLTQKLNEASILDSEAPSEVEEEAVSDEELSLDAPAEETSTSDEELSLDAPSEEAVSDEELSLDAPSEEAVSDEELSLDVPAEEVPAESDASAEEAPASDEELSLDAAPTEETPAEEVPAELDTDETDEEGEEEPKIETSLAGVGILPLLAEIQDKLANGKPSEVELAALKAMKKLF